jgi:hypothetical protein
MQSWFSVTLVPLLRARGSVACVGSRTQESEIGSYWIDLAKQVTTHHRQTERVGNESGSSA